MIHDLTKKLIDKIHAQTLSGSVEWTEGPGKHAYAFEADAFNVVVDATASTANLVISDTEGRELENLTEEELAQASNGQGLDYEQVVREVHSHARRSALGTDNAIEKILGALDGKGGGGEERRGWR